VKNKAAALAKLHRAPPLLVLPNAWDSASARVFEDAGFPAIVTTRAGIAYAQGYADKEKIGRGRDGGRRWTHRPGRPGLRHDGHGGRLRPTWR
jgi:hypothetical protein